MLWSPKVLWDTWRGVVHVNWIVLGMSNTPLIAHTKIIEPMVFVDYLKKGIAFHLGYGMATQYPSKFQKICEGTQFFIWYTLKEVLHMHWVILGTSNTFSWLFRYVMEPKGFLIYFNRGITCALNNFGHKQYSSNSLDQNNSIHGIYKIPLWRYFFPFLGFELLIFGGK